MNEELQRQLVSILSGISGAVSKASDFALSQLPDIAQQYVLYGRVLYTAWFITSLLVALASAWVIIKFGVLSKAVNKYGDFSCSRILVLLIGTSVLIVFIVFIIASAAPAALVWFAPKVWLLQELAHLVKG